jgi:hypothetical protein
MLVERIVAEVGQRDRRIGGVRLGLRGADRMPKIGLTVETDAVDLHAIGVGAGFAAGQAALAGRGGAEDFEGGRLSAGRSLGRRS